MKLKPEEITRISKKLLELWKREKIAEIKQSDAPVVAAIAETFHQEFSLEDQLNKDVEKVLSQYENQFESGKLDRRKMFQMVRVQLAKEKKIVL